jgi:putative Mg2+ transporter-C (MgtC) family protein
MFMEESISLIVGGRVALALALGAVIGLERQWRQRMAGLRTNALVAGGAALFVTLGVLTPDELSPTRVAAQVVSGIGFLGAGVILREGLNVRGLNTAATLWCAAAVGTLVGSGWLVEGAIGAVAILLTNVGLRPVGRLVDRSPSSGVESETFYQFFVTCRAEDEPQIRGLLVGMVQREGLQLRDLASVDQDDGSLRVRAGLLVRGRDDTRVERVASRLSLEKGVTRLRWNAGETFPE